MRAVTLDAFDTPPRLRDDLPAPTPAANEVLVRVRASSVNPADNSIAAGMLKQMGVEYEFPRCPRPRLRWPEGVDLATACAAPVAGIAAFMAIDALELSESDTVLIVGAPGGVGSFAVQLAARAGATVVAPALPEDEAYLRGLGVSELLPRDGDLAAAARERHPDGFDAVLDLVNYAPGVVATLVRDGGRVGSPTGAAGEGPGRTMVIRVSPALVPPPSVGRG